MDVLRHRYPRQIRPASRVDARPRQSARDPGRRARFHIRFRECSSARWVCGWAATASPPTTIVPTPSRSSGSATPRCGSVRRPVARTPSRAPRRCWPPRSRWSSAPGSPASGVAIRSTTGSAIRTVAEAFPGRLIAGLGVSHPPAVEARGEQYDKPLSRMRDVSRRDCRRSALVARTGRAGADRAGRLAAAHAGAVGNRRRWRPSVLRAGRAHAACPPDPRRRDRCWRRSWRSCSSPTRPRPAASPGFTPGASISQRPTIVENLRWLGFDDADFADGGSDELVDAIVAWGDAEAIVARIRAHLEAGADHVCLQPVTHVRPLQDGPDHAALDVLRALAPALQKAGLTAVQ